MKYILPFLLILFSFECNAQLFSHININDSFHLKQIGFPSQNILKKNKVKKVIAVKKKYKSNGKTKIFSRKEKYYYNSNGLLTKRTGTKSANYKKIIYDSLNRPNYWKIKYSSHRSYTVKAFYNSDTIKFRSTGDRLLTDNWTFYYKPAPDSVILEDIRRPSYNCIKKPTDSGAIYYSYYAGRQYNFLLNGDTLEVSENYKLRKKLGIDYLMNDEIPEYYKQNGFVIAKINDSLTKILNFDSCVVLTEREFRDTLNSYCKYNHDSTIKTCYNIFSQNYFLAHELKKPYFPYNPSRSIQYLYTKMANQQNQLSEDYKEVYFYDKIKIRGIVYDRATYFNYKFGKLESCNSTWKKEGDNSEQQHKRFTIANYINDLPGSIIYYYDDYYEFLANAPEYKLELKYKYFK